MDNINNKYNYLTSLDFKKRAISKYLSTIHVKRSRLKCNRMK